MTKMKHEIELKEYAMITITVSVWFQGVSLPTSLPPPPTTATSNNDKPTSPMAGERHKLYLADKVNKLINFNSQLLYLHDLSNVVLLYS